MIELLSLHFFRNALVMGLLLGLLFGILSFFVVLRRMTFLGAGISHTAFGGVALGVFLGINPFATALVFCVAVAILLGKLIRYGRLSSDTGIGIFFSLSMALGAVLLSLRREYTADISGYLFGNILGVTTADNIIAGVALVVMLPFIAAYLHRIIFMTFDEEVAAVSGVRVEIIDTVLLIFLAAIIVISMKMVGIILVSALIVLPASFGLLITQDYRTVLLTGILYAAAVMTGGLVLSYYLDIPAGGTIVMTGAALYFILLFATRILRRR